MKKIVMSAAILLSVAGSVFAQNKEKETFETFKEQRNEQEEAFMQRRADEFREFKARYQAAFDEFKELYRRYLEEEESVLDLMASDDGIKIKPVKMAPAPKVVTNAAEQKQILRDKVKALDSMKPEDFLPLLSEEQEDTVVRMQEAASAMEDIVSEMRGGQEGSPEMSGSEPESGNNVEVTLEPFDPEYFSNMPEVDEAGRSCGESVDSASADQGGSVTEYAEDVPHGKPTEYVRISSPFGTRIHPITRRRHTHKGVDLAAPRMTPVYATADGVVTYSGRNGGYGNFVKINHRNGYKTAYAHMHKIEVRNNAEVHKGDLIGYVGSTGSSTGNHLHYELYYQDGLLDPATTL